MFIINCKNYDEVAGEKIIKLAKLSERISKKKDGYCKVSDFIEIKKINLKIIDLTLLVLL